MEILLKETSGRTVEEKKDYALVLLALNTISRKAELCDLKIEDIHDGYTSVMNGRNPWAGTFT